MLLLDPLTRPPCYIPFSLCPSTATDTGLGGGVGTYAGTASIAGTYAGTVVTAYATGGGGAGVYGAGAYTDAVVMIPVNKRKLVPVLSGLVMACASLPVRLLVIVVLPTVCCGGHASLQ